MSDTERPADRARGLIGLFESAEQTPDLRVLLQMAHDLIAEVEAHEVTRAALAEADQEIAAAWDALGTGPGGTLAEAIILLAAGWAERCARVERERDASAPTIEEVALALGEQHAHLAPYQTHDQPDGPGTDLVPAVWWAVHRWEEDELRRPVLAPVRWTDDDGHDHALAGPTREDALVAAGEAIRAGRFEPIITCPGCYGSGIFETECCSGAGGCSCRGQIVEVGSCNVCQGRGTVQGAYDRRANIVVIEGFAFIGTGPASGWDSAQRLGVRP